MKERCARINVHCCLRVILINNNSQNVCQLCCPTTTLCASDRYMNNRSDDPKVTQKHKRTLLIAHTRDNTVIMANHGKIRVMTF